MAVSLLSSRRPLVGAKKNSPVFLRQLPPTSQPYCTVPYRKRHSTLSSTAKSRFSSTSLHNLSIARSNMDAITDFVQRVPQAVQWGFAGVGALYLGSKLLSYLNLLLNVFVLSGTDVSFAWAC